MGESKVGLLVRVLLICLSGNLLRRKLHYFSKDRYLLLPAAISIKQNLRGN